MNSKKYEPKKQIEMTKREEFRNKYKTNNDFISDVSNCAAYSATNQLRYKAKEIDLGKGTAKVEYRLQQMWQGTDGSQIWEWIECVD